MVIYIGTLTWPAPTVAPVPGALFWYNAQALVLSNGDPVSTWPDLSGNSLDLTLNPGDTAPLFETAGINGHPAVEWASHAVRQYLVNNSGFVAQPWTLTAVLNTTDISGTTQYAFGANNAGPAQVLGFNNVIGDPGYGFADAAGMGLGHIDTIPHSVYGIMHGASSKAAIDTGGLSTPGTLNSDFVSGWCVGGNTQAGPNIFWQGYIGEIIGYPFAFTDDQYLQQHRYFKQQWGTP